jgi:uncharacterized protein YdeI (YjbR/CyaY-like superfamily)
VGTAAQWRSWLSSHHLKSQGIWLVFHRKGSGGPSISYDQALDEALAYGWIDSLIRKIDDQKYARKFTQRKPGSIWSGTNIERVGRLCAQGRMTKWGLVRFENRSTRISDLERLNAEGAQVPEDFEAALKKNTRAWSNFQRMAPSRRKRYLVWLMGAKRPGTRKKRIAEAVKLVSENVRNLLK